MRRSLFGLWILSAGAALNTQAVLAADGVSDFYKGKTVSIIVGSEAGGPYDFYSRVTRVNHGRRIYVSGLYATGKTGEAQVKNFFDQLRAVLKKTGGDLDHLAKATYFVADDEANKQLNVQRLRVYDARRPPAASKATVTATGRKDCGLVGDFIAVRPR